MKPEDFKKANLIVDMLNIVDYKYEENSSRHLSNCFTDKDRDELKNMLIELVKK